MLSLELCHTRQCRLLALMDQRGVNAVVLGSSQHVYYFTGYRPFWLHEALFVMRDDGQTWLICGKSPDAPPAVASAHVYPSNLMGTQRQEQAALAAAELKWIRASDRLAIDTSAATLPVALQHPGAILFDEPVWQLRRQKDPDELALMRRAIACTEAMYRRAREIIEPGIPETRVYGELHAAAVAVAGEPLWPAYLGNDYACGVPGGPPALDRLAKAGELYILDLGPAYRGYFSDNARTFAVDRKPTDAQHRAWQTVTDVFLIVERLAKPGVRCRDLFEAVNDHYQSRTGQPFPHHLGHGVGLQPHEFPHLNPNWDDVLMENEVFTAEPGLYAPELRAGMRIENQYRVTETGVENLTPFPMGL